MNSKLISVIMSVYNNENEVIEAVKSILNQTYDNFEFLIMDDASKDNTLKNLKSFEDRRIKILHNDKNLGLTRSLNILIGKSRGFYLARQDSDDQSLPTRFEEQIKILQEKNLKACTTRAKIKNSERLIPKWSFYIPKRILIKYKNPFIHGSLMIEKNLLESVGSYDDRFKYAQDYKLFNDLIKNNIKIKTLNKALYILNMQNNISTKKFDEQQYYAYCVKKSLIP